MEGNKEIKEAVETFDNITSDEELRRVAELRQKAIWDENNMIATAKEEAIKQTAKKMLENGISVEDVEKVTGLKRKEMTFDGMTCEEISRIAELRQKAIWDENNMIATAMEKGIEKGKLQERKELARKMLESGISIEEVKKITGLTDKEIK